MCGEWRFSKGNCSAQLSGAAAIWWERLSGIQFKVQLYDVLLLGVVTFGHVTNMAVTPFDPPLQKPPTIAYFTDLSSIGPDECQLKFYIAALRKFAFFVRKNCGIIKIFRSNRKIDASDTDVITPIKFDVDRFRDFRSLGSKYRGVPLTRRVALTTVLQIIGPTWG